MSENPENKTSGGKFVRKLIDPGTKLIVSTFPGLLSGSAEEVLYGAGGVIASTVLESLGQEFSQRYLGPKEKERVGAVLLLASKEIHKRRERGDSFREDGFFDEKVTGRKDAEEVMESVLLKCQRDPEEKKIKYMAKLLSNICFDSEVSVDSAHRIIKIAEQLTYRQFCILKICAIKDSLSLRKENYRSHTEHSKNLDSVLYEYYDLYLNEYIGCPGKVEREWGPTDIVPSQMNIQDLAEDMFDLMGLGDIPLEDLNHIIRDLE